MAHTDTRTRLSGRRSIGRLSAVALAVALMSVPTVAGSARAATAPTTASEISTAEDAKVGTILVAGNTVYTVELKAKTCTGKCLKAWRPVLLPSGAKKPTAGDGVDAKKLGTVAAAEGARQVTYDGDPLYWSSKDKDAGDVKGAVADKFGTGALVVTAAASAGGSDTDAGTGGTAF